MTDSELNRAIAEAMGWTDIIPSRESRSGWEMESKDCPSIVNHVPDFARDLRACYQAEELLNKVQQYQYAKLLLTDGDLFPFIGIHATTRQRAEALLAVLTG